jgi:hypothetical protein
MVEAPISTPDPGSWENIDKKTQANLVRNIIIIIIILI